MVWSVLRDRHFQLVAVTEGVLARWQAGGKEWQASIVLSSLVFVCVITTDIRGR